MIMNHETAVRVNNQPTTLGDFFLAERLTFDERAIVIRSLQECGSYRGSCRGAMLYGKCVLVDRRANEEKTNV